GRIHFLGKVEDMPALYRAMDLFVLPSFYDACSNAVLEALACGLKVLSTTANGSSVFLPQEHVTVHSTYWGWIPCFMVGLLIGQALVTDQRIRRLGFRPRQQTWLWYHGVARPTKGSRSLCRAAWPTAASTHPDEPSPMLQTCNAAVSTPLLAPDRYNDEHCTVAERPARAAITRKGFPWPRSRPPVSSSPSLARTAPASSPASPVS
ncbi:MAG: glycosyltransferase family 4 protein, partial [Collinsella sp.]|nr:glycosyltransferase family 4 protein [Collinsella sp.]